MLLQSPYQILGLSLVMETINPYEVQVRSRRNPTPLRQRMEKLLENFHSQYYDTL